MLGHNVYKSLEEESQMKVKREISRAVQNRVMLAKAMVEAIFSRDVLSNGRVGEATATKQQLDVRKINFVKTVVFLAIPVHEDSKDEAWIKITDEIDMKCRGIARNETKKRGARSEE